MARPDGMSFVRAAAMMLACGVAEPALAQRQAPVRTPVAAASATPAEQRIEVAVGEQKIIDLPGNPSRVAVGQPEIADVGLLRGSQLRVLGMTAGATDIVIWSGSGRTIMSVSVTGGSLGALRRAIAADPRLAGVTTESEGGRVLLRGRLQSVEAHASLLALARAHLDQAPVDTTTVDGDHVVAVEVKFAAVGTRTLRSLGFDFRSLGTKFQFALSSPGTLRGYGFSPAAGGSGARFTPGADQGAGLNPLSQGPAIGNAFNLLLGFAPNNILAGISALAATDLAQILAEPTLVVRSGESANFLAGGEIPIPVPQGGTSNTITIEYKPFGVRLDVAAVVLSADRISLRISPEVSELDFANALTLQGFNVPAIRKRSTSTTVELGDGQSFVLAGLTMTTNGNADERLPGLGDLPIIGVLFKRVNSTREAQELIIIATPRLVRPIDAKAIPPLPGAQLRGYAPTTTDMLIGRNTVDDAIGQYGLMR